MNPQPKKQSFLLHYCCSSSTWNMCFKLPQKWSRVGKDKRLLISPGIFANNRLLWEICLSITIWQKKNELTNYFFVNLDFTLFKIFIFCPKIQLRLPEKIVDFSWWKTRENVVVLDFLAVDNFDFTRQIVKKIWGEKLVKCWGLNFWTKIWLFE